MSEKLTVYERTRQRLQAANARIAKLDAIRSALSQARGRLQNGDRWITFGNNHLLIVTHGTPYAANTITLYEGGDLAAALTSFGGEENNE